MYTILRAIVGYFFLLLVVRLLTRRPGAQMTLFEFVIVFLIGGVTILETVGDDRSVVNCVAAIVTITLLHRMVSTVKQRSRTLGAIIDGTPLVLLKDGNWQMESLRRMRLADDDVMAAARTKGVKTLDEIEYAILERNGGISIIKRDE